MSVAPGPGSSGSVIAAGLAEVGGGAGERTSTKNHAHAARKTVHTASHPIESRTIRGRCSTGLDARTSAFAPTGAAALPPAIAAWHLHVGDVRVAGRRTLVTMPQRCAHVGKRDARVESIARKAVPQVVQSHAFEP